LKLYVGRKKYFKISLTESSYEKKQSITQSGLLYGEAHRCRLPLLPSSENVLGGNGIQRLMLVAVAIWNTTLA